jgi:hypothetical protein
LPNVTTTSRATTDAGTQLLSRLRPAGLVERPAGAFCFEVPQTSAFSRLSMGFTNPTSDRQLPAMDRSDLQLWVSKICGALFACGTATSSRTGDHHEKDHGAL